MPLKFTLPSLLQGRRKKVTNTTNSPQLYQEQRPREQPATSFSNTRILSEALVLANHGDDKSESVALHFHGPAFDRAQNAVLHNPIMIDKTQIINQFNNGRTIMEFLKQSMISGAGIDSSARYPPPRCHPGTRRRIKETLRSWIMDDQRHWSMTWLYGQAGVGKSAIAQTMAEYCEEHRCLGAAFFFSRPNKRDDPSRLVPTLAYQFAVRFADYKHFVTEQLANDPEILNSTFRVQFRKLIAEPFSHLTVINSPDVQKSVLVILDGLDECDGEEAQCEIIELINELVRLPTYHLPLLWLICSRPEPYLRSMFSRADFRICCAREELTVAEGLEDVELYLRDGFKKIHEKYQEMISVELDDEWPTPKQVQKISAAAAGLFVYASTALNFIGDPEYADPESRLRTFLTFTETSQAVGVVNPLGALSLLYKRILSALPEQALQTAKLILAFCALYPDRLPSAQALCNFLRQDRGTFYSALRRLHAVLHIPPPKQAKAERIRFFHASFEDFLLNSDQSGVYCVDEERWHGFIAKNCLQWYNLDLDMPRTSDEFGPKALNAMTWASEDDCQELYRVIMNFVRNRCWSACSSSGKEGFTLAYPDLRQFNFNLLRQTRSSTGSFAAFVNWLNEWCPMEDGHRLIRTVPTTDYDRKIHEKVAKYLAGIATVKPAIFPLGMADSTGFFFLGYGIKTCLIWYDAHLVNTLTIAGTDLFTLEVRRELYPRGRHHVNLNLPVYPPT